MLPLAIVEPGPQVVARAPRLSVTLVLSAPLVLHEDAVVCGDAVDLRAPMRSGPRRSEGRAENWPPGGRCRPGMLLLNRKTPKSSAPVKFTRARPVEPLDVEARLDGVPTRSRSCCRRPETCPASAAPPVPRRSWCIPRSAPTVVPVPVGQVLAESSDSPSLGRRGPCPLAGREALVGGCEAERAPR